MAANRKGAIEIYYSFSVPTVLRGRDLLMSPVFAARASLFALFVAIGVLPSRAVAEPPPPPLELTAANLAGVVDPLMANWIDKRKGPSPSRKPASPSRFAVF